MIVRERTNSWISKDDDRFDQFSLVFPENPRFSLSTGRASEFSPKFKSLNLGLSPWENDANMNFQAVWSRFSSVFQWKNRFSDSVFPVQSIQPSAKSNKSSETPSPNRSCSRRVKRQRGSLSTHGSVGGVGDGALVWVGESSPVGVGDGSSEGIGVEEGVGVSVRVGEGSSVIVGDASGDSIGVGVSVGDGVRVSVGVGSGVGVSVGSGKPP
jgi:hypothetical protein